PFTGKPASANCDTAPMAGSPSPQQAFRNSMICHHLRKTTGAWHRPCSSSHRTTFTNWKGVTTVLTTRSQAARVATASEVESQPVLAAALRIAGEAAGANDAQ